MVEKTRRHPTAIVSIVFALTGGCATMFPPTYTVTKTGDFRASAKPSTCEFAIGVSMTHPDEYVEVGVVDVQPMARGYTNEGVGMPKTIQAFKSKAAESVCQLGGDFLVAEANGLGDYIRGVVFARKGGQAAPSNTPTERSAPVPTPPSAATRNGPTLDGDPCALASANPAACQAVCESQKQAAACHRLGEWYELGNGVAKSMPIAVRFYQLACEQGSKSDCVRAKMLKEKNASL